MQTEIILYVKDQRASALFYAELLNIKPVLDVAGMTEFQLNTNCKLGLMPEEGIAKIITPALPHPAKANGIPRCELYLMVDDISVYYERTKKLNAKIVNEIAGRDWGDTVFYLADTDGHVIAFAEKIS